MRTSFEILKRDVRALVKNPIALLVVGALLVLPGLYAWYCIVANWDPYSHTGNIPIAIVNEDEGATHDLAGDINIGQQVVGELEDNDSIDWRFYDSKEEALEDTEYGLVYATIVLPSDLSENLVGIFDGSDEKPTIYYYPNEKYSAVATKVSDSAAQKLVLKINQGFSSTVNKKILSSAQDLSNKVSARADETHQSVVQEIQSIQADLDTAIASLDDASSTIAGWRKAAQEARDSLETTSELLPDVASSLDDTGARLNDLRSGLGNYETRLSTNVLSSAASVSSMSSQAATSLDNAKEDLSRVSEDLQRIIDVASGTGDEELKNAAEGLSIAVDLIGGAVDGADARVTEINGTIQQTVDGVTDATNRIHGDAMPKLDQGATDLYLSLTNLSIALRQFEPQVESLSNVLSETDAALSTAEMSVSDAKILLGTIRDNLGGTMQDIGAIGNALEVEKLTELLGVDVENAGTFISTPVQMSTAKLYPVSNYGTAVAPFYTNLALWIGCFILVSLMKVEVMGFSEASARQRYFGRWLLFVILSLLQSQAICGVDILLGIDCGNPVLFMLSGAVCSFAYMNLIYALVKTFRNIGKTLCIFLLVMQVPGSSGMYPIQMMPDFFQFIHPALPFTYGIDAMREALSGLYGSAYVFDLLALLLIVPGSLLIGLALRSLMANLLVMFDDEMRKTGFFASEDYEGRMRRHGMRGLMRALMAHDEYAEDVENRAHRFYRRYPRIRRLGVTALWAIPLGVLLVMLPLNVVFGLSTDTKLAVLVGMLVFLFVVQMGLIVQEYTHSMVREETQLLGQDGQAECELEQPAADKRTGVVSAAEKVRTKSSRRGPTRDIFITDLRLGSKSVIGIVVTVLLVLTPSIYAWFNIASSWDPYGATGGLKVAVANEDEGYKGDLLPITINVGDTVVSQLRGNASFDWVFVDDEEAAKAGVESSEYYAAIVIPSDFSANLLTYLTEDSAYPSVFYYTNEKENPIAPIITQKGADSIQESIRVSFTERVDQVSLGVAYDILSYVKNPRMSDYVSKMSRHLDDATADAKSAAKQLGTLAGLMRTTSSIVDLLGTTLDGLQESAGTAKGALADAESGAQNASESLEEQIGIVRDTLNGNTVNVDKVTAAVDVAFDLLTVAADAVPDLIQGRIDQFQELMNKSGVSEAEKQQTQVLIESLKAAKEHAESTARSVAESHQKTNVIIDNAQADVEEAKRLFNEEIAPADDGLRSSVSDAATSAKSIVSDLDGVVSGLNESTGGLSNQLEALGDGLSDGSDKLDSAATRVSDAKQRVADALASGDVKKVEQIILGNDAETLAASLARPVQLQRESMYSVSNYGSAMAPFYTVLSLWVGALVMISTMRVHVVEERLEELRKRYGKLRPRHEFFGRYGIFCVIGLLQSSLVLLGDLMLLHIQCANPVGFFLLGLFVGQMFCLIVYTITELFGDVGKAVCVILLIMQVAASGGTFPVEMFEPILIDVASYLPFTYAMTLLQECVAGPLLVNVVVGVAALLFMAGAMLVLGLPLRRPFRKTNAFFEEQLEKTGFM